MRIGIVELMDTGHPALAETLSRIFCTAPENKVTIYTSPEHANNLDFLSDIYPNLGIESRTKDISNYLKYISGHNFDRIYIVTLNNYFTQFAVWENRSPLHLVIHNTEEWFENSWFRRIGKFLNSATLATLVFIFKQYFIYVKQKRKILQKVKYSGGKIVVLSEAICRIIAGKGLDVEVIPFSVFNSALVRNVPEDSLLKICIPGILSQYRRNYNALFDLLQDKLLDYRDNFTIDLLGGIQPGNPLNKTGLLLSRISKLKSIGFSIKVHNVNFIPPQDYDRELSMCDIILGNMNVKLNRYSQYGRTKETGIPFAMIKAGKPGILPEDYQVPENLRSGILTFSSFEELTTLLIKLIENREIVRDLKEKALSNSILYSPENIYKQLLIN